MSNKITIAIDGYSSTGKSTIAKQLANYDIRYVTLNKTRDSLIEFFKKNNIFCKEEISTRLI